MTYETREDPTPTVPLPALPPPPAARAGRASGPSGSGRRRRDSNALPGSRIERIITWVVLTILAGADAFGFFLTLTKLIQKDSLLVGFFVVALALSSVAAAHTIGARVRSLREGYGGSVIWVALISALWLSLGLLIAWVRAWDNLTTGSSDATGDLAPDPSTATTAGHSFTSSSTQLAGLLLVLYLLTGVIAMTHAYRFGDPRSAEIRKALRERRELADQHAQLAYQVRLAEGVADLRRDDRERDDEQFQVERGSETSRRDHTRIDGRQQMSRHFANPQFTDALTTDDPTLNDPENRGNR
jgi:hypothetical protein